MAHSINFVGNQACATTSSLPTTFHDWPRLPDELKVEILSHALTFDKPISGDKPRAKDIQSYLHEHILRDHLFPLIGTRNRHPAALAQEVYYKENTFLIHIEGTEIEGELVKLSLPKVAIAQLVRHLQVHVYDCYLFRTLEDTLLDPTQGFGLILKPTRPLNMAACLDGGVISRYGNSTQPDIERHTAWQASFNRLKSLELTLTVWDLQDCLSVEWRKHKPNSGGGCPVRPASLDRLEG